jgi:hypothetical protein
MKKIHVGAMTMFTYPRRQKDFSQFIYHGEKYFQLKLVNIQKNSENFLINSRYLNIILLVGLIFISEC